MTPHLNPTILRAIWRHAEEDVPNEAVGMLYGDFLPDDGTTIAYTEAWPLTNISNEPTRYFALDRDEFMEVMKPRFRGRSLVLWHSHVKGLPKLSEEDCEVMWAIKLPMLVVSLEYACAVLYSYGKENSVGKRGIYEWGKWAKP